VAENSHRRDLRKNRKKKPEKTRANRMAAANAVETWNFCRGSSFLSKHAVYLRLTRGAPAFMFSEHDPRPDEARSLARPENFKGEDRQCAADTSARLSPLPARNTLLTVIFFSALAVAILYWIFFPPAPAQVSENSPPLNAQPAEQR
jgi:hypothetical protein